MTWDITTPVGTEAISSGDDRIREFKSDLQDALQAQATEGDEAIFPGDDTTAPVYRYRGLKGTTAARPTAGYYGLYINTTTNEIQRDNGSSWDDVATLIPGGTVMVFYQATAPTGWTKSTAVNDKALRVVSGTSGGSTGGTVALSAGLAHTHTVASHVHAISQAAIEHKHQQSDTYSASRHAHGHTPFGVGALTGASLDADNYPSNVGTLSDSKWTLTDDIYTSSYAAGNTNGTALTTASTDAGSLAYADVILATKD